MEPAPAEDSARRPLAGADGPTTVGETTTVAVEDPDVATVVAVEVAPDGSNASVRAALMDTDDADSTDRSDDDAVDGTTDDPDSDGSGATETASAPAGQSAGAGSDADWTVPTEVSGFGSLPSPATVVFAMVAGLALLGGAAYLRRRR